MSAITARSVLLLLVLSPVTLIPSGALAEDLVWSSDIEGSLRQGAASGKPVLMEFTASWCSYCKRMEKTTFTDPEVAARINEHFVPVRVDADKNKELVADLAIKGLPAILVVSPDLQIIERISGFQTPEALIARLDKVAAAGKQSAPSATVDAVPERKPATAASPAGTRRELEFEAITEQEAARPAQPRNVRPISSPNAVEPRSVARPNSSQGQGSSAGATDSDQFFETIQRDTVGKKPNPMAKQPSFHGTCLVSAVEDREIVPGSVRYQITYRDQLLLFQSEDHKQKFLAAPANYWPMLDGSCPMSLLNDEKTVEGEVEHAAVFRKRIWLFASEQSMREFLEDPAGVVEEIAEQNPSL